MRPIDGDALEELFREVISYIAKKPEMSGNLEHMVRASAMVVEMIKDAPTIEPERKTGHWVCKMDKDPIGYNVKVYVCSECRKMYYRSANYCSNCGADMRGGQDGDMPD